MPARGQRILTPWIRGFGRMYTVRSTRPGEEQKCREHALPECLVVDSEPARRKLWYHERIWRPTMDEDDFGRP